MKSKEIKTILITSAIQGEGKSTIAFNLALSLAEVGKKVVLVDCDLHKPSIKKRLSSMKVVCPNSVQSDIEQEIYSAWQEAGVSLEETTAFLHDVPMHTKDLSRNAGLAQVLKGEAKLKDALAYYEDLNFTILADIGPESNATELLGTSRMKDIIVELEDFADYVILDSAPAAILSDASDLARLVDGVLYVVKQDHAKVNQILESFEDISESSKAEIIGFVLNETSTGFGGYGYGYGYNYK